MYINVCLEFMTENRACSVSVIVYEDCGKKSKKSRGLVEVMPAHDWKGLKRGGGAEEKDSAWRGTSA